MQLIYLLLACLPAFAAADSCTGNPSLAGHCTPETWTAQPINSTSPTIAQCQDACQGVNSDAGDWFANLTGSADGERRSLVGYACQFSVGRGCGQEDPLEVDIANQDILDIYSGVIARFGSSGLTSASGTMNCSGKILRWWVD